MNLRTSNPCRTRQNLALLAFVLAAMAGCSCGAHWLRRISDRNPSVPPVLSVTTVPSQVKPVMELSQVVEPPRPESLIDRLRRLGFGWHPIGESIAKRPIEATLIGQGEQRVLLIGGIHGDEPEGLPLIEWFTEELQADPDQTAGVTVLVVRNLNPDGTAAKQRTNQNGVDLNRNFPAENWDATAKTPRFNPGAKPESEPETRIGVQVVREFQPRRVLVMHATSGKPMNNFDGPGRELATALSRFNRYAVTDTIGYPTPGSLGSWVGIDLRVPIITLELPRKINAEKAWSANKFALREMLKFE